LNRKLAGAVLRSLLVVAMFAMTGAMLPGRTGDIDQIALLISLLAGAVVLEEYSARAPALIDFRDAPPFNRIRFAALFTALALTAAVISAAAGVSGPLTEVAVPLSRTAAALLDFPYSPVRVFALIVPADSPPALRALMRATAAISYLLGILAVVAMALSIRLRGWPLGNGPFNFWINLPTFDPTAGGDVVTRLVRATWQNLAAGFALPFVMAALMRVFSEEMATFLLTRPHSLIWVTAIWGVIPASLIMRGLALARIAELIESERRARSLGGEDGLQPV